MSVVNPGPRAILSAFLGPPALLAAAALAQTCPPGELQCEPTIGSCQPHAGGSGTLCCLPVGPDVIVGDVFDVTNYSSNGSDLEAVAFGTTACNVGDQNICWLATNNQHPVIAQNLFKFTDRDESTGAFDTFEHIGQSWLKHTFSTFTLNQCGCGCNFQGDSVLGVGCSDPYCCGLNGQQGNLGPKYQVNASTGLFCFPPANPPWSGPVARRLQVKIADLEPTSAAARFFAEAQYVAFDDAAAGNHDNNASYRETIVSGSGAAWTFSLSAGLPTHRQRQGIRAWRDHDPFVRETEIRVPGENGLFILACKVTDLGTGLWHYEYALQNLNSHRSGRAFTVPLGAGAGAINLGFHDVDYHSGDGWDGNAHASIDGTDWSAAATGGASVTWATQDFSPGGEHMTNALRWGTLYNFRFDSNTPPITGLVTIELFRPGDPASVSGSTWVPAPAGVPCPWDNECGNYDGLVAVEDMLSLLAEWDQPTGPCDFDGAFGVDIADLLSLIAEWGPCEAVLSCPWDQTCGNGDGLVAVEDLLNLLAQWNEPAGTCDFDGLFGVDIADLLSLISAWGPCP